MNRRRNIDMLRRLAETAEAETARAVADRRRRLETEDQRLGQLRNYLAEYRALSLEGNGVSIGAVRARREFVARLQAGIEEQERVVTGLRQQVEADLGRWRDARTRSLALTRLGERIDDEATARDARREQAELDEIGRRMFRQCFGNQDGGP